MKASDVFVRSLENEGVSYVFGVPGEENLDILESLRTSSIRFITTRHEQAAGFMAATVGRLTGRAGVALSTVGPGATNFVTAAAYATLGGMPALFVTGQKPVKKNKQGRFQIVNTVDILQPVTKSTRQIVSAAAIPAAVRNAFRVADEERPGATHLELPEDIASEETDAPVIPPSNARRSVADEKSILQAVKRIEAAKRPLVLVGAGANRKRVAKMLRAFMRKTGIPAFSTQLGKGVVDETSPDFLGVAALSSGDFLHRAVEAADLILNIGHDIVEKPPFLTSATKADVIHFNFTSAQVDEAYHPAFEVVGDVANALWQIGEHIAPQAWDFARFREIAALREAFERAAAGASKGLTPRNIIAATRRAVPAEGIVALDNGMYKVWFARNYPTHEPNTLLLDNALATMGAGLPSAMAAKLLFPERPAVAVVGDGGFMMSSQELETAVRLGLDLSIIILNDNGFGMIRWKQEGAGFPDFGLGFGNPDFPRYADACGAAGRRAASLPEFEAALLWALGRKGVSVIEVPVDYSENVRAFSKDIPEAAAKA